MDEADCDSDDDEAVQLHEADSGVDFGGLTDEMKAALAADPVEDRAPPPPPATAPAPELSLESVIDWEPGVLPDPAPPPAMAPVPSPAPAPVMRFSPAADERKDGGRSKRGGESW